MIYAVEINEHNEQYAPPEKLLRVELIDDVVFLSIVKYEETHDKIKEKRIEQIGVKLLDLAKATLVQHPDAYVMVENE